MFVGSSRQSLRWVNRRLASLTRFTFPQTGAAPSSSSSSSSVPLQSRRALSTNVIYDRRFPHTKTTLSAAILAALVVAGSASILSSSSSSFTAHCDNNAHAFPLSRNFVADVVEVVSPAVVNIMCSAGYHGMGASSGSGFIISSDGVIVTNAHVVAPSADGKCVVTLHNGKKRNAMIKSMDAQSDIAIIKIDDAKEPLPVASLGTSSKVRSGEFVIAIGSPMHLQNSASLGIVSATARHASELGLSNNRSEYIQTDAAINVGNSGGPLVNLDGEVIGINTMKVKGTDGISFAIPIDIASQIIKQLLERGKVTRPYVGLKMALAKKMHRRGGMYRQYGGGSAGGSDDDETQIVVLDVVRGSPAHLAGLESDDTILEVNGKPVSAIRDVLDAIGLDVGKTLSIKIRKLDGRESYVKLTTAPARDY